jgi:hypothetical protein
MSEFAARQRRNEIRDYRETAIHCFVRSSEKGDGYGKTIDAGGHDFDRICLGTREIEQWIWER